MWMRDYNSNDVGALVLPAGRNRDYTVIILTHGENYLKGGVWFLRPHHFALFGEVHFMFQWSIKYPVSQNKGSLFMVLVGSENWV